MQIAILDDDSHHLAFVAGSLTDAGHSCHAFGLPSELLTDLDKGAYDLMILDWMLPEMSGLQVLATVRALPRKTPPILFVTSRDAEKDVIEALDKGADDYLVKPVRTAELLARVKALLRRSESVRDDRFLTVGPFTLDQRSFEVKRDGVTVDVTEKEYKLALVLLSNLGRPLSRKKIREDVWGRSSEVPSRTLDTHVSRVRAKLGLKPEHGFHLTPIYGLGYRLDPAQEN